MLHNVIHAEPMMVVTRETIKGAIITADSLGKGCLRQFGAMPAKRDHPCIVIIYGRL
jgi:hypothetical protein